MAFANNVITAPVSIYDVQRCLGLSSNDVGTLCASERIKRWAKFKPVNIGGTYGGSTYINTYPLLNASTKRWNESLSFQWWRDTNRHNNLSRYGIIPVIATSASALYTKYAEGGEWLYYPPMGGSNYPYRLIDFNQYYHNAPEPAGLEIGNFTKNITGSWTISFALPSSQDDANPVSQRNYVVPKDILRTLWPATQANPNPPYYGIMIYNPRDVNNPICAVVTSDTISGTDTIINSINILEYDKDYYIIPFYSNQQISLGRVLGGATLAAIPNSSMGIMHTSQSGTQEYGRYILKAQFTVTGRFVVNVAISTEWKYGVQYNAHTFQDVTMYVCLPSTVAPDTGAPSTYVYKQEYYNIYIEANSRWDATPFDPVPRPTQDQLVCYLYEDGKKRVTANAVKPQPIEPPTPTL